MNEVVESSCTGKGVCTLFRGVSLLFLFCRLYGELVLGCSCSLDDCRDQGVFFSLLVVGVCYAFT